MSRRRRGESAEPAEQEEKPPVGEGPQVKVVMSGSADEVADRLKGVAAEAPPEKPRTTRAEEIAESNEQFFKDLSNANYTVKVKRLRPKMWQGQKLPSEVWANELPLQWEEIKSEVTQLCGGGTYKVAVVDPSSDKLVSAKNFEAEGDPTVEQTSDAEIERIMMQGGPKDAAQTSIEGLDRRAQVTAKMIEVESLEHQLEEARNARNGGGKKNAAAEESRINDLERRLTESKHQAELEARDRKHQEEMRELKALIAQNQKPVQQGPSEITVLIQQMQKAQESSDKRFTDLMKQMQDDKMNQLLQKIDNLEKRPREKTGGLLDDIEGLIKIKKVLWGNDDDDDDGDDEDDDRPWWQKALDRLGDKLTPKVIDKLFAKLDGLETSKGSVTKDEFMKLSEEEIAAHAQRVVDEEIQKRLALEQQKQAAALPPPAPKPAAPPAAPGAAAALPPETPPAPAAPPAPAPTSLAQKLCQIAAGAIAMIEHELELRPRNYEWTFQLWDQLPEELLDRVFAAPGPIEIFDAFRVEGIDAKGLDEIKAKVAANPKMVAWLKRGYDDLIEWKKKLDADPSFEPGDEDEEDEVEAPE